MNDLRDDGHDPIDLVRDQIVRLLRISYDVEHKEAYHRVCAKRISGLISDLQRPLIEELQKARLERDQAVWNMARAIERADTLEARLRAWERP